MKLPGWLRARFKPKTLGQLGEDAAARHLKRGGYRVLSRGHDSHLGELDIIAVDGRTIVFVEVKTRRTGDAGHPAEAVDLHKQRRMTRAALGFMRSNGLLEYAARFDVVAITWPADTRRPMIEHFKNAFSPPDQHQFYT